MSRPVDKTVRLLQSLIRARSVNEGTRESGQEIRAVRIIEEYLAGSGIEYEIVEPAPGRASLIARLRGTDPDAPSLALVGHLDVVHADPRGWQRDPFAAELVDGWVWGRGAVDMLGLTSAFVTVADDVARGGVPLRGDLVLAAVADEEAGGVHGVRWIVENRPELLRADYALTENGGIVLSDAEAPGVTLTVGEKSGAGRRLTIDGTPSHGSMPFGSDNAAVTAATILRRIAEIPTPAEITEYWRGFVEASDLDPDLTRRLLDVATIDAALPELGPLASYAHATTHLTVSPNVVRAGEKINVVPGVATIDLDIRLLPGQTDADVDAYLARVLEGLEHRVTVEGGTARRIPSISAVDTPLRDAFEVAVRGHYPGATIVPIVTPGGTDAKHLREAGTVAYGFGLYSRAFDMAGFRAIFHGDDERVDVESIRLTTEALRTTIDELLGGPPA